MALAAASLCLSVPLIVLVLLGISSSSSSSSVLFTVILSKGFTFMLTTVLNVVMHAWKCYTDKNLHNFAVMAFHECLE